MEIHSYDRFDLRLVTLIVQTYSIRTGETDVIQSLNDKSHKNSNERRTKSRELTTKLLKRAQPAS